MTMRILHCMRSPVGGLFRHVLDLAGEQHERGHDVGLICDASTGGARAGAMLAEAESRFSLGIHRIVMPRLPGIGDWSAFMGTRGQVHAIRPDILHGHGAKGGAYARLCAARSAPGHRSFDVFYTPHGGTLHYDPASIQGRLFFAFERFAQRWTSAVLFESRFGKTIYTQKIGAPSCAAHVVHNGVGPDEFEPVAVASVPANILFIGEMRALKGVMDLLEALALLRDKGHRLNAALVGSGPDEDQFRKAATALGLARQVTFHGAMPARAAFRLAKTIVVPSRHESLPYIVLEAGAAGVPMVATNVGGIPEIFADHADRLVSPADPVHLADALLRITGDPDEAQRDALALRDTIKEGFSVSAMTDGVMAAYGNARCAG